MDTQRKYAITKAEIDAMTDEELLRLVKTQGKYVGQRFTTVTEDHFHDRVLDAPHFLRRLCQVHPKQFSKLLAEFFLLMPRIGTQWASLKGEVSTTYPK